MVEMEFDELIRQHNDLMLFKYEICFEELYLEEYPGFDPEDLTAKFEEISSKEQIEEKKRQEPKKAFLKLKNLFCLKFLQEKSENYLKCLRDFLQNPSLVDVVELGEEINLVYRSREELLQLLWKYCGVRTESALKKLEQRAGIRLPPGEVEYKVLVYVKEGSDLKFHVADVMWLLRDYRTRVGKNLMFNVFVPNLLETFKLITNKKLLEKSIVIFSTDNVIWRSSYNGLDYLNGDLSVAEKMFLRMLRGSSDTTAVLAQVINKSKVKKILQDWNGELVFTFSSPGNYNKFLQDISLAQQSENKVEELTLVPHQHVYSLVTPFKIDVRDFLSIDPECSLSKDSRKICSKNKTFAFACFTDDLIMKKYSLKLSDKCILRK